MVTLLLDAREEVVAGDDGAEAERRGALCLVLLAAVRTCVFAWPRPEMTEVDSSARLVAVDADAEAAALAFLALGRMRNPFLGDCQSESLPLYLAGDELSLCLLMKEVGKGERLIS